MPPIPHNYEYSGLVENQQRANLFSQAMYAIGQQKMNADCSYFFFKHGNNSKSQLSACLRSLAFQMACTNAKVRETLSETKKDDIKFNNDNDYLPGQSHCIMQHPARNTKSWNTVKL